MSQPIELSSWGHILLLLIIIIIITIIIIRVNLISLLS
jgi:hypothetical protein